MDFKEFIKPEFLILIPVLYGLGMAIKATPKIQKLVHPIHFDGSRCFSRCHVFARD